MTSTRTQTLPAVVPQRPGLADLVGRVRRCVERGDDPAATACAVADVLAEARPTAQLLTRQERAGRADDYARHTLHCETQFSISAVVWRPGQVTEIHDHLVWCSFIVLQGVETETVYEFERDGLIEVGQRRRPAGSTSGAAPPDDIHRVANTGDSVAITLHVYGADLSRGTSVRRTY